MPMRHSAFYWFVLSLLPVVLWIDSAHGQGCVYPDVYLNFDQSAEVSKTSTISVKSGQSTKVEGLNGNAETGVCSFSSRPVVLDNFAIEMMFRKPTKSWRMIPVSGGKSEDENTVRPINLVIDGEKIAITVKTIHNDQVEVTSKVIKLNGFGVLSPDAYMDGDWHHLAVFCDFANQTCQLFFDGITCEDFMLELPKTDLNAKITLKGAINNKKHSAEIDQVAFYVNSYITPALLAEHASHGLGGANFDFCDSEVVSPVFQEAINTIDTMEFSLGYTLDNSLNLVHDVSSQVSVFPNPRYKENHGLHYNFPWVDYRYLVGIENFKRSQGEAAQVALDIQQDLISVWNFPYTVYSTNKVNSFQGKFNSASNENPEISAVLRLNWHFANPKLVSSSLSSQPYIKNLALRKEYYHTSSVNGITKDFWRSESNLDPIRIDGLAQQRSVLKAFEIITRPIDLINENGEMPALIYARLYGGTKGITSKEDPISFLSNEVTTIRSAYRDQLLNHPYLKHTDFSYYSIDGLGGHTGFKKKYEWETIRSINSPINEMYYSTMDFYPYSPERWMEILGPHHGYSWVYECREEEGITGDKLFSPFVCAGWRSDPRGNLRPAQYLALLKALGVLGAEFYYASYFNEVAPEYIVQDQRNWIWQLYMPSYAQAVMSHAEEVLKKGEVLKDESGSIVTNVFDGVPSTLNVVRELWNVDSTEVEYLITTSFQTKTNFRRVISEKPFNVTLQAIGTMPDMTLISAFEGRTYWLKIDKTKIDDPVICALDNWHEPFHPERWSSDVLLEAELFETSKGAVNVKTENVDIYKNGGDVSYDFSDFTTYVSINSLNQEKESRLVYTFQPRVKDSLISKFNVLFRIRKPQQGRTAIKLVLRDQQTDDILMLEEVLVELSTDWNWYGLDGFLSDLNLKNRQNLQIEISSVDEIELDRLIVDINDDYPLIRKTFRTTNESKIAFDLVKQCGDVIKLENHSVYSNGVEYSYTLATNRIASWKSGKKSEQAKEKDGKYYITGKNSDKVAWWDGGFRSSEFILNVNNKKNLFVKLEVFENGERVDKKKIKYRLTQLPKAEMKLSKTNLCLGDTLSASCTILNEDQKENYNLSWSPTLFVIQSDERSAVLYPNQSTDIELKITDAEGCSTTYTKKVEVEKSKLSLTYDHHPQICVGDNEPVIIPLKVEGNVGDYSVLWDSKQINPSRFDANTLTIGDGKSSLDDELYKVIVTDSNGCKVEDYLFLQINDADKCK